ncbi:MAG: threonine ammonia-lyase [Oscillospiraceae bacterium]|nr:threonine ammonia-lyase [Oscillospiraceae bacterium]MDD4369297.1 threonine ammonia-lyase [Oscillospiraceae bacterium]
MSFTDLSLEHFQNAYDVLKPVLRETPLVYSEHFSKLNHAQCYLKPENMQLTGAFKIRGAYYAVSCLSEAEARHGLVTASAGNHAQGLALAGQLKKLPVTIVMPETTPLVKVNNTKGYGANVILKGATFDDAADEALRLSQTEGLTYIHPFDNLNVAAGQGTMVFDILRDQPETDVILVPVGGGGLATGVAVLAKLLKPDIKVFGVEPTGAASLKTAFRAGHPVTLPSLNTIADGVAVKRVGDQLYPFLERNLDGIITVPDEELVVVFLDMLERHKMLVENAGLLSVAALRHLELTADTRTVSILSGGNMDVITMSSLVQHGLIARNRVFTFTVLLPDRPGELEHVAHIIAAAKGNIIRLDHNQFISINRNAAVELKVTLEAFGAAHKDQIMQALKDAGYDAHVTLSTSIY